MFLDIYCFRTCENSRQSKVCGSDGNWYKNLCELRKLKCNGTNGTEIKEVSNDNCENSKFNGYMMVAWVIINTYSLWGNEVIALLWHQLYNALMCSCSVSI